MCIKSASQTSLSLIAQRIWLKWINGKARSDIYEEFHFRWFCMTSQAYVQGLIKSQLEMEKTYFGVKRRIPYAVVVQELGWAGGSGGLKRTQYCLFLAICQMRPWGYMCSLVLFHVKEWYLQYSILRQIREKMDV